MQRKVPLAVVPSASRTPEASLSDLVELCKVLFKEEQHAFRQAVQAATDRCRQHTILNKMNYVKR